MSSIKTYTCQNAVMIFMNS